MPWRAWGIDEAMQPSSVEAPAFCARRPISTWVLGVMVAQLTKIFPRARTRSESPASAKTAELRRVVGDDGEDDVGRRGHGGERARVPAPSSRASLRGAGA